MPNSQIGYLILYKEDCIESEWKQLCEEHDALKNDDTFSFSSEHSYLMCKKFSSYDSLISLSLYFRLEEDRIIVGSGLSSEDLISQVPTIQADWLLELVKSHCYCCRKSNYLQM